MIQQIEEVKILLVGTKFFPDNGGTYEIAHSWLELEVPLSGTSALFDAEEKARNVYEEIPSELIQFKVEYFWQSEFHWQSETIKKFLNEYGDPKN